MYRLDVSLSQYSIPFERECGYFFLLRFSLTIYVYSYVTMLCIEPAIHRARQGMGSLFIVQICTIIERKEMMQFYSVSLFLNSEKDQSGCLDLPVEDLPTDQFFDDDDDDAGKKMIDDEGSSEWLNSSTSISTSSTMISFSNFLGGSSFIRWDAQQLLLNGSLPRAE